jgi:hypothetical protein
MGTVGYMPFEVQLGYAAAQKKYMATPKQSMLTELLLKYWV